MSRYCGEKDISGILSAAEHWKNRCLLENSSVFTQAEIWTRENIECLQRDFVDNIDEGEGKFLEKLKTQLASSPPEAKRLCAEMMWIMLLCPSNIKPPSKRKTINYILSWANSDVSGTHMLFSDQVLSGIGSAGTAYNTFRWRELVYVISFYTAWLDLPSTDKERLLSDSSAMADWLQQIPENEQRQFRHMLMYLLFPDNNERVFGAKDRMKIAKAFTGKPGKELARYSALELDYLLADLRSRLETDYGTDKLDWYISPVKALWLNTAKKGETEGESIYPVLTRFLAQAETTDLKTADYPARHSGLAMRISFGAANQAHAPWISFLTEGQSLTQGIYPAYLYFKTDKLLLLVKGVSEMNTPHDSWNSEDEITLQEHYHEHFNKKPISHNESLVVEAYDLSRPLVEEQIESDLAELIEEYKEITETQAVKEAAAEYSLTDNEEASGHEIEPGYDPEIIPLSVDEAMDGVFVPAEKIKQILDLLSVKKNVVLQGAPGVGKTFVSKRLAYALMGCKDPNRVEMVQFHQSYAYEDFVQGYRPGENEGFELKNGLFYQFCQRAAGDSSRPYIFIIDEINRGNLSKIFGELMMLIEADKRGPEWKVPLTYSKDLGQQFYVPENVHIIGLMNTADRSLSLVDYALRRRFAFVTLEPGFTSEQFSRFLKNAGAGEGMVSKVLSKLTSLNERIAADTANLGRGFCIGHSFFCSSPGNDIYDDAWFEQVIRFEIEPLLQEYWFDDPKTVEQLMGELLA